LTILRVAVISGADNGSLFMPFGVLTFSRPFAILSFYRKHSSYTLLIISLIYFKGEENMKKLFQSINEIVRNINNKAVAVLTDTRGDLATNTIGGIIVAVVIIGLLIVAVNQFFPGFFQSMFNSMQQKLNANW
jgi:hypothetical protein